MRKYIVTKAFCRLYATEDLSGEVSDEALFGTVLEVLRQNGATAYCRTDYGYFGYVNLWELQECSEYCRCDVSGKTVMRRCDLLREPSYRLSPVLSLPAGSRVISEGKYDERFIKVRFRGEIYYLHKNAFRGFDGTGVTAVCGAALSFLGTPYRWGGRTHMGIDCSGLVFTAFSLCGIPFHRDSAFCEDYAVKIPESEAGAGDIVYFDGHIGLLLGGDLVIHASASRGYVVREKFGRHINKSSVKCYGRALDIKEKV